MRNKILFIGLLFLILWTLPFLTQLGLGQYDQDAEVNTTVNITNSAPLVSTVTLQDPINLIAYNTTTVTCNATVFDYDNDTVTMNGTLFYYTSSPTAQDDNNDHYTNTTCTLVNKLDEVMNFTCAFEVQYYANNGSWYCNVTALDDDDASNSNQSGASTLNPLVAIDVPGIIDFGDLAQGQTSGDILSNVTNVGNRDVNISVRGWGATEWDGLAMDCQFGKIDLNWERYHEAASQAWAVMYPLQNQSTLIPNYYVAQQTNDSQMSLNATYWKLQIPIGAGGVCTGKVLFTANDRG